MHHAVHSVRPFLLTLAATLAIAAVACGSGEDAPAAAATAEPTAPPAAEERTLLDSLAQYPSFSDDQSGFGAILGTPDLAVGLNRVSIVLTDEDVGIVKFPFARVETFYAADGPGAAPFETVNARYFDFPLGVRGLHVSELNFDRAGQWEIKITIPDTEGNRVGIRFPFEVAARTKSVALGEHIPPTANRTLSDVESASELTTSSKPDLALYDAKIDDLVSEGRPFVLTFASPAFCTNALCGPQDEVLSNLNAKYSAAAEFIHIDLYENPHEIKGDLARARRTRILEEWGVHTDEWTFIVDGEGRVAAKFEAFVSEEELEQALRERLGLG